jgi:uroporphyrinogen-III synthase
VVELPLLEIAPAGPAALLAALARLARPSMRWWPSSRPTPSMPRLPHHWPAGVSRRGGRGQPRGAGGTASGPKWTSSARGRRAQRSEHLLQALDLPALQGKPVLIIRGDSGRELMADGLRAAGAVVDVVPAYRQCRN